MRSRKRAMLLRFGWWCWDLVACQRHAAEVQSWCYNVEFNSWQLLSFLVYCSVQLQHPFVQLEVTPLLNSQYDGCERWPPLCYFFIFHMLQTPFMHINAIPSRRWYVVATGSMILTHIPLPLLLVYVRASSLFRLSFQRTQTFMPLHWKKGSGIIYRHKGKTQEQGMAMFINHSSRVHFYAYKTRFNVKCYNTLANTWLQTGLQTLAQQRWYAGTEGTRKTSPARKDVQQFQCVSLSLCRRDCPPVALCFNCVQTVRRRYPLVIFSTLSKLPREYRVPAHSRNLDVSSQ